MQCWSLQPDCDTDQRTNTITLCRPNPSAHFISVRGPFPESNYHAFIRTEWCADARSHSPADAGTSSTADCSTDTASDAVTYSCAMLQHMGRNVRGRYFLH